MSSRHAIAVPESVTKTDVSELNLIRGRFSKGKVRKYLEEVFSPDEIAEMEKEGVDQRMVFGINPHYHALAIGGGLKLKDGTELLPDMPPSKPVLALIMPRIRETMDMEGEQDPSNQMKYTPDSLAGRLLHKYDEIVLGYTSFACSAHCRYCYRLDLFNRSTGKGFVRPQELRDYITRYNDSLKTHGQYDSKTGKKRYPIREVLLSGGDPMVMTNGKLYQYLVAAGQAGVKIVRIGTKEMAFRPERFDENLREMLRIFHNEYPKVHINFVVHFSHPDEFLERDKDGHYIQEGNHLRWLPVVRHAVENLLAFNFISIENQTPMIERVNDDVDAQHRLHQELRGMGIKSKYIFQCREIEGHRAFSVPVEKAWKIHNESQKGLSDTARSRFVMSAEHGKTEVVSVIDGPSDAMLAALPHETRKAVAQLFGDGLIVFKMHRSPSGTNLLGDMIIAKRNPHALWLTGYEDRIIYDGRRENDSKYAGLLALLLPGIHAHRDSKSPPEPSAWSLEENDGRTAQSTFSDL